MFLLKFFIPIFTFINIVLYFIGEFSEKKAKSRGWPTGITWLGRMLWIVPIGLAFIGVCKQYAMDNIYDLVEKQHGIRFNATKIGDHTYEVKAAAAVKNDEVEMSAKEPVEGA